VDVDTNLEMDVDMEMEMVWDMVWDMGKYVGMVINKNCICAIIQFHYIMHGLIKILIFIFNYQINEEHF